MTKIFHVMDEMDERSYGQRGGYGSHEEDDRHLEKALMEGCEHVYKKAMRELEGFNERGRRTNYREGFEEKIEKLKERYR